jgi:hypothetical protein
MVRTQGAVDTGIQQTTKDELELRAGSSTISKVDVSGIRSQQGIVRHKNTISTSVTIASDETAVAAGPLTIDSTGTLEVASGGIMVIV